MTKEELAQLDPDGIPPGVDINDLSRLGDIVPLRFAGHFYAQPQIPRSDFMRPSRVLMLWRTHALLQDIQNGNLYLIDRTTNVSVGCRMDTNASRLFGWPSLVATHEVAGLFPGPVSA